MYDMNPRERQMFRDRQASLKELEAREFPESPDDEIPAMSDSEKLNSLVGTEMWTLFTSIAGLSADDRASLGWLLNQPPGFLASMGLSVSEVRS